MKTILMSIQLVFIVSFGYCTENKNGIYRAIDTTETVNISGSNQIIRIKGSHYQNPVLLYLNGGPGDSVIDQNR